ncbi:MAG: hypothetical protein KAV82_11700 [Phycisphaerae bacterium]|nr:hypothetical protein [Phycisphaerae bacterium]
MISPNKLDTTRFFKEIDSVAAVAPASELFSLLSRSLQLPADFAALVRRETGDRVLVTSGGEVPGDQATEVMFIRTSPLELSFERTGLSTKDAYLCDAHVTVRVSAVPERSEAESFRKAILGSRRIVRLPAIAEYLEPVIADALIALADRHEVEGLVDGKHRDQAAKTLGEALAMPCFTAGLTLAGAVTVTFESAGLREVRAKQARTARRLDEHAAQEQLDTALAQARAKHMDELESTLKHLRGLAVESPHAELPDLLRTFEESERAKLYAALFESQAVTPATEWIVVAGGSELLFFAPGAFESPARRVVLEGEIGPLRSVRAVTLPDGRRRLLAGAARGVYELGVEDSAAETVYAALSLGEVRGGVNSVAVCGDWIFATHSELGLLRWHRAEPQSVTCCCTDLTRNAKTIRNVQTAAGRVFFSVDERVVSFAGDDENDRHIHSGSATVITAVLATGRDLFAGNADGQILHWPEGETTTPRVLHGGSRRPAESIALLTGGGVPRLFYTDTTLAVFSRVVGDTFTCRYEAGGQTLQRAVVASDLIVATDDPRQRLLIWRPDQTSQPIAGIHVARLTNHSIQDTALVPLTTPGET